MLSNAYFLAKFRFDTAENEPSGGVDRGPSSALRGASCAVDPGRKCFTEVCVFSAGSAAVFASLEITAVFEVTAAKHALL